MMFKLHRSLMLQQTYPVSVFTLNLTEKPAHKTTLLKRYVYQDIIGWYHFIMIRMIIKELRMIRTYTINTGARAQVKRCTPPPTFQRTSHKHNIFTSQSTISKQLVTQRWYNTMLAHNNAEIATQQYYVSNTTILC